MDEKIKKSAVKLQDLVNNYDNPNEVFQEVRKIAKSQPDYFNYLGPDNILKLTLYIYSLKKSEDFKLGEKMVNNLYFAHLITTNNDPDIKVCKHCGGDGEITCPRCKGDTIIKCSECDGDGKLEYEDENYDCNICLGDGEVRCPSCIRGESICPECEGSGELESEYEVSYTSYFITTWDKQIQSLLELRVGTLDPIMSEYQFSELSDKYLELSNYESAAPLNVSENEMYCIDYSDEPQLFLEKNMSIRTINRYLDTINKNYLYL
jgi:hypothetical protein